MSTLELSDFRQFFSALYPSDERIAAPYPWQERLLRLVVETGTLPTAFDLPTGTGKTSLIDILVFALALEADGPPSSRRVPLRIVFVVDRRTIVDQAFSHARHVAKALRNATGGVLYRVAERLRRLASATEPDLADSPSAAPLAVGLMRGGVLREETWARSPVQPTVLVSTVDQVGSRLLFRGYGVSDGMKPIHAGLLGHDCVYLLDEVHLAHPFERTLSSLETHYLAAPGSRIPNRFWVGRLSATLRASRTSPFRLDETDRASASLARRLAASKPIALVSVPSGAAAHAEGRLVTTLVEQAVALLSPERRTVLVVCNRVDRARRVAALLRAMIESVVLVTGRMRPLDRAEVERRLIPRVRSGRDRVIGAIPLVVVATQCIEAGADFDFDGLVTECASLDAVTQRLGRCNRAGEFQHARVVIVGDELSAGPKAEPDAVYGAALRETWTYLQQVQETLESLDGSPDGLAALPFPERHAACLVAPADAPLILPAHLDLLAMTSPRPSPDPDPALWLHGEQRNAPDVQVVWRADLDFAEPGADLPEPVDASWAEAVTQEMLRSLALAPPSSVEAMAVPIYAVRRWLEERATPGGTPDGETGPDAGSPAEVTPAKRQKAQSVQSLPVVSWDGDDSRIVGLSGIRPGATLVVPSKYGGISNGCWDPSCIAPATDLGDQAQLIARGRLVLRADKRVHPELTTIPAVRVSEDDDADGDKTAISWLSDELERSGKDLSTHLGRIVRELNRAPSALLVLEASNALAFTRRRPLTQGRLRVLLGDDGEDAVDVTTDEDASSNTGVNVRLDAHLAGVEMWARRFAVGAGLSDELVADLARAAGWHDLGKADPRFQRMLRGGSVGALRPNQPLLAKSAIPWSDSVSRRRAQAEAGYPIGERHELLSVAMIEAQAEALLQCSDPDLVLHLVGSHHGKLRPFATPIGDPSPRHASYVDVTGVRWEHSTDHRQATLGAGGPERFWRLIRRYGWHGLAFLEAIVRLADHRRSEEEQSSMPEANP